MVARPRDVSGTTALVRKQYERFPYPPIPRIALPRRDQGESLRFDTVAGRSSEGIDILICGGGTFEPLVVAQMHPRARGVTVVELSEASAKVLRSRDRLARVLRWPRKIAPISVNVADLWSWQPPPSASFEFVLATNVLHHTADPAALLLRIARWLKPGGYLRLVTYPKGSRLFMRHTAAWLKEQGLTRETPNLVKRARDAIVALPEDDPIRSCFLTQPETRNIAGLVDAFFHACENPLSPLEWEAACKRAGLELVREGQDEWARSSFLDELVPRAKSLDAWTKLQVLDDLLELTTNPILWLRRVQAPAATTDPPTTDNALRNEEAPGHAPTRRELSARNDWRKDLGAQLTDAEKLLRPSGVSLNELITRLREEVGPREANGVVAKGLSVTEYDPASLR